VAHLNGTVEDREKWRKIVFVMRPTLGPTMDEEEEYTNSEHVVYLGWRQERNQHQINVVISGTLSGTFTEVKAS